MLQLSGRPVTKCNLWNGRATQILPDTGPAGNSRISFAKVHVRSSQMMQPCWTCGNQNMHIFVQYFYVAVHETSSSPFAQFDLILGWTTWKWLWATWNYNEMLKQPICERIGHGWRFHALYAGPPKIYVDQMGGPLGNPGFLVSCNTEN